MGHPVILLTGDAGTGKTLVLRALAAALRERERIAWIDGEDIDASDPFDDQHGPSEDAPAPPADSLADDLRHFLDDDPDGSRHGLLIVDDAHDLPASALSELCNVARMTEDRTARVPIVLAGGPDLRTRLTQFYKAGLHDRIGAQVNLPPIRDSETAGYIAHRLAVAKCACHGGLSPFDAGSLKVLHHWSGGVPARLNELTQHCLRVAHLAGLKTIGATFTESAVRAALSLPEQTPLPANAEPKRLLLGSDETMSARTPTGPTGDAANAVVPPLPTAAHGHRPSSSETTPGRRRLLPVAGLGVAAAVIALLLWNAGRGGDDPFPPETLAAGSMAGELAARRPNEPPQDLGGTLPPAWLDSMAGMARMDATRTVPLSTKLLDDALKVGRFRPADAAFLYQRAALWGNARAAYYLGQAFETGDGVGLDLNRARAWYRAAGDVWGAEERLDALQGAVAGEALSPAVPIVQFMLPDRGVELHWRAIAGESPASFAVEFEATGGEATPERVETDRSAILLTGPVHRWRIITLDEQGRERAATGWISTTLPPG